MPPQSATRPLLKNSVHGARLFIQLLSLWRKRITGSIHSMYPGNWFNDFRNIEVTLEEMSAPEQPARTPAQPGNPEPGSFLCNTHLPSAN